ncbi:MAG: dephospho-CoA kinase [Acidimicrobiia bacterium]
MLVVALTGGIGAGKSTVAAMLAARGALVIDADVMAREVVEPGQPAFDEIVLRFGPDVIRPDGFLDRAELARRVFNDEEARKDLEQITHPAIGVEFARRLAEAPGDAVVVLDIPLFAEVPSARERGHQSVIVVEAPPERRLDRLQDRGVPRSDAERRMATQASDEERRAHATWVLDNGRDELHLQRQVDELWPELDERRRAG